LPLFKGHSEYALRQAAERGPDLDFIVNDCARSPPQNSHVIFQS